MRKYLIVLSAVLLSSAVHAQTNVVSGVTRGKDYGVVYSLPKTEINIQVKASKVTYTPGEFGRYADRYLRLNNVSATPEEHWELSSIELTTVGVPDKENTYFIQLKDRTVAPLVELTQDGLIKSINVPFSATTKTEQAEAEGSASVKKKVNPRDFLTEEILMANSSAKMAELISKEIYNIRESRNALVRGQADTMPTDGEQLKLMLSTLDEQEKAMVEMFSGVTDKEEHVYTIRIVPDKEFTDEVIFRFSKKLGVLGRDDLAGEPFFLNLKDLKVTPEPVAEDNRKQKTDGVAYNVPGKARVTVTDGKRPFFEGDLPVTQFGVVEYLASALFNKNAVVKVFFYPETGGLKKVERE